MLTERGTTIRRLTRGIAFLLSLLLAAELALAQGRRGQGGPVGGQGKGRAGQGMGAGMGRGRGLQRHGPGFLRRLRELPPAEQERVLANDARFQGLPAERQQMIRDRLKQWNALTPEQKERIREREEIFLSLSPAQRQEARAIFPQWLQLRPERRQEIMQAFRRLRDAPRAERNGFLSSPGIAKQFSPEERDLLTRLAHLLPQEAGGPSPEASDETEE